MKKITTGCIAAMLYTLSFMAVAAGPSSKYKMTVSLETKVEMETVSIILHDDQSGVYHHFILEKSLDGKTFFEVNRVNEETQQDEVRTFVFRELPFDHNSLGRVFYRVRAVDELGWFDFTNVVTVQKKQDLADQATPQLSNLLSGPGKF